MDTPGSITVRVKDGSLKCGDLDVECNYADKVRQLKQMISAKSPMHPDISDQRLIYSGHMLGDEQTLKDVFTINGEVSQSSFTVHLAYRGLGRFNPQNTSSQSSTTTTERPPAPAAAQPTPNPGLPSFSMPFHPGQQEFQHIQMGINPDVIALHEFYVRQMMTYMVHWSQFALQVVHPTGNFDPTVVTPRSYVIPQPVPQEPVIPARNPGAEVQENARINEVVNRGEEDDAPRDVLDWMYTLVRVALIFSLVYFYSNFTRFFLVVLFTALVMVFQRRQVVRAEHIAANRRQPEVNVPPPPAPAPTDNSQGTAEASSRGNPTEPPPNQSNIDASVSTEENDVRPDAVPEEVNNSGNDASATHQPARPPVAQAVFSTQGVYFSLARLCIYNACLSHSSEILKFLYFYPPFLRIWLQIFWSFE
ncbi:unnamed protein product [Allacma fusca]|uniref:Ubiquitin-like domain-containing protein n=1 Tax=Allacma fusca TaxID=39272 RepID=A0A8J2PV15_9HEXA|nr:unnamed protein product [Allacma fusca]